jgi:hypothetical protein
MHYYLLAFEPPQTAVQVASREIIELQNRESELLFVAKPNS